ncbi:unnamed protein product [Rotaria socialis]|uniref:AAA+ ATPase domain-containing protein n=1 Tax=Rotaria socialis TaxID=392032 RepID=A0A818C994_9BILA|nr:unnamed protein product [Rotaria socialis]CAF3317430.1 unnamed protein product [Rotaria socialis]CAF3425084.1 unnamed protein product [Rotaria socialis]CAF3505189.1 unnamed protein product [Rotaria socialis]CAF3788771.1 unnamed protein product [Rotaria socialis]
MPSPYMVNNLLVAQLKEFLLEDGKRIRWSLERIAPALKNRYREYQRQKLRPFTRSVEKAYEILLADNEFLSFVSAKNENLKDDEISSDSEDEWDQQGAHRPNTMNQMVSNLYASNIGASSQGNSNVQMETSTKPEEEQQAKRKQTTEKSAKKVKRKRPAESTLTNDVDGPDVEYSTITFEHFAASDSFKENLIRRIYFVLRPEGFIQNGKTPPRGFLLHGPPGVGKSLLAQALAGELKLPILKTTSTELVSGISGDSEFKIRKLFEQAKRHSPCILFIDEIEAISQRRESASKDMERRIVTQLLACLDELSRLPMTRVVIIGSTNRPDSLDPALRRAGRFDHEISLGIPNEIERRRILTMMCRKLTSLDATFDLDDVVMKTPGFVGADLSALIDEALVAGLNRKMNMDLNTNQSMIEWIKQKIHEPESEPETSVLNSYTITMNDFHMALKSVQPSSKREGFATVPDVTFDDIGALKDVREELSMAILASIRHPTLYDRFGFVRSPGVLLVGPPGCGKTLLAKAIANESGINFISVKGPELLNMYVGESERAVRQVFQRARDSNPCVIFFDEIDALCPRRTAHDTGSTARVVNQLLTEMDGVDQTTTTSKRVYVMAATNRMDILDPAILRPGRLDKHIYVGLPNAQGRFDILRTITKNGTRPPLASDVNLEAISDDERCHGYTGADLAALIREASEVAMTEHILKSLSIENACVYQSHIDRAFSKMIPSVSEADRHRYEELRQSCLRL